MRLINCPLCEQDHTRRVHQRSFLTLTVTTVLCPGCGLVYHNPVVEDQDRMALGLSARQLHTNAPMDARHRRRVQRRAVYQHDFLKPWVRPGLMGLEVGAGLGVLSAGLQQQGVQILGVEPDPQQAEYARRQFGLTMVTGRFEELDLSGQQFDLILASHVIEHFPDPLKFLITARSLAAPGGRLFLETPNILVPKVGPRRVFSIPHNFYFTPQTLTWMLLKAGWQVERTRVFRRDSFLVMARASQVQIPSLDPAHPFQVWQAICRHRYLYYLKFLFLLRKIPAWQRHWMYQFQEY
ncbi:MAG: class I SAM-dependent methyltransferase [Deltaproteobacteria bacterium]|nr:class I SAM-dependent methyltransferase [Deltaproteobacteria bacterium]